VLDTSIIANLDENPLLKWDQYHRTEYWRFISTGCRRGLVLGPSGDVAVSSRSTKVLLRERDIFWWLAFEGPA